MLCKFSSTLQTLLSIDVSNRKLTDVVNNETSNLLDIPSLLQCFEFLDMIVNCRFSEECENVF